MRVLMISGDRNLLTPGTSACARMELQRKQVEQLDVFVWPQVHSKLDIWRATRANQYDVVTVQDPFWRGLLAWKFARRFRMRLNVQVHTDLSAQSFLRRALAKFVLRRADSVRVVSEKIKKQVERTGVRARIDVLPIFVDVEPFRTLERKPHEGKIILWVGRFEDEKDPVQAIEILKEVRKVVDAKLVMLGSGSLEQKIREASKGFPVEFPGWHNPLPYMVVTDVVLSTSKHESWGASIVEALAAGVPVVAPDVGIAKEAGAIIVPRTELASALAEVLKSTDVHGELKLHMPSASEWVKQWKATLL